MVGCKEKNTGHLVDFPAQNHVTPFLRVALQQGTHTLEVGGTPPEVGGHTLEVGGA